MKHGNELCTNLLTKPCTVLNPACNHLIRPRYRAADKSLAQPGRKQANVSVTMA